MKRIIDGKTYNTETATKIAEMHVDDRDPDSYNHFYFDLLYQTRFGAYFRYCGHEFQPEYESLIPQTAEEARKWMEEHASVELIEQHFGEMPEAGDSESRYTLRMPDSLKQRIDTAAKMNSQSTNAWIIRALEATLEGAKS